MRRKGRQTEQQASIRKFLDRGKHSIKRLKALQFGLEKYSATEVKQFYTEHSTDVFYVLYGSFTTLETTIQDKLLKGKAPSDVLVKELTDLVLPQFLQVLISLPELVHRKWQFNSICLVIRKLLHSENHMKLRQYGVQLLVLWVEALQENAGDSCMELFASVVPHFPPQKTPMGLPLAVPVASGGVGSGLGERYGVYSTASASRGVNCWGAASSSQGSLHRTSSVILLGSGGSPASREVVCSNVLHPLMPHPAAEVSSKVSATEELMVCLLECLTEQTCLLHWDQPGRYLRGFARLFFLFKLFYLACLYKDFRNDDCLYTPPSPLLTDTSLASQASDGLKSLLEESADGSDTATALPANQSPVYQRRRDSPYRMSSVIKLEYDLSNPVYTKVKNLVLAYVLRWFLPDGKEQLRDVTVGMAPPLLPPNPQVPSGTELMRQMWFASRDNVSLLLEICRQGFITLTDPNHQRLLVDLYWHWNQVSEKPRFMLPPSPVQSSGEATSSEEVGDRGLVMAAISVPRAVQCWEQLSKYEGFKVQRVEAGMAASFSMMIAHTQQVFIHRSDRDPTLQKDLCRKVLRLYQDMVVSWMLDKAAWEYLLSVLLCHTWKLLTHKDTSLGLVLATTILKTLLVCFLRVSVAIPDVSPSLWDDLLKVMHSLTHWKEVIQQWKAAMNSITEVLAQAVYGLCLHDLPLDNLTLGQRQRTSSMGRSTATGRHDLGPARLSSFSVITEGPPPPATRKAQGGGAKYPGKDQVDGGTVKSASTSTRGHLYRSSTQEEQGSPMVDMPSVKRHSTPVTTGSRPSCTSFLAPITEFDSPEESSNTAATEPATVVTPYQPLLEDDELAFEEEEDGGAVIANLNARSPTPSQDGARPLSAGSPSQEGGSRRLLSTGSPTPSQSAGSPTPSQEEARQKGRSGGEGQKMFFKHRSKGRGSDLPPKQSSPVEDRRKKRKWFHKRSGSDSVMANSSALEMSIVSDRSSSSLGLQENRQPFTMHKSSSEGNIHMLYGRASSSPDTGPEPVRVKDSETGIPFRRVTSIASPISRDPDPAREGGGVLLRGVSVITTSSSGPTHRPLRRSLTLDSPEPTPSTDERFFATSPPVTAACSNGSDLGGWGPKVAAVVWLRMLKVMGNINDIQDASGHAEAVAGLDHIWNCLSNIQANSGISVGSHATPPLPEFMPPLDLFLPWVVEACSLPAKYSKGKEIAYQLLCKMIVSHWHTPPSLEHLAHFYHLMHVALGPSSDTCAVAVKYGYQLFSHGLTGSSVLLLDCVSACGALLEFPNSTAPHNEALYMLGSVLHLPDLYSSQPLPSPGLASTVRAAELKEHIVEILFTAATRESARISRCIALYLVGTLVYSELYSDKPNQHLPEGVDILLASLQFADRGVAMSAVDMMSLLSEVGPHMLRLYPSMPFKVVQAICYAIAVFLTEDLDHSSWVDKVVVTLLLLLRDWLMVLPLSSSSREDLPPTAQNTIRTVFEVLQAAAGSHQQASAKRHALSQLFTIHTPVTVELEQLVTSTNKSTQQGVASPAHAATKSPGNRDILLSSERLRNSPKRQTEEGRVQTVARSVLTHLLNLLGHFPYGCGAAQLSSSVKEHHDCPSLSHLDDISTEVFDSPRMQFFALDNTAVVSLVEIPTMLEGVPEDVSATPYQTRIIIRDVTGKYTWDSTLLYGPDSTLEDCCSLLSAESLDSLVESVGASSEGTGVSDIPPPRDLSLNPPSWRTHANSDRDVLQDLLEHVELTSPECISVPAMSSDQVVTLCQEEEEELQEVEGTLLQLLHQQQCSEQSYIQGVLSQPGMRGEKAIAPHHYAHTPAFHHCCVFLSHLGLLSWDKRNHLNLLNKTNQLILELKNLDLQAAQSRATYKVAVLYVAPGQEDKVSILNNSSGSHSYEEFVSGLGWEVNMETHAGYMAGMQKDFASCSMPYYATSSEEILFHVATRMTFKLDLKVRHLGNDEVHIIWSEHWRDYRRSLFKTQFADVLIVLYPLSNGLIRVHIDKKPNVPQFGPLFDGALVDRFTVAALVRATAINGLRAQRNPLIGYRGRYEERLKYIQTITSNQLHSTYEDFCENVMHPLEMSSSVPNSTSKAHPRKSMSHSAGSVTNTLRSFALSSHSSSLLVPQRLQSPLLRLAAEHEPQQRQRSSTNDDRMTRSSEHTDQLSQPPLFTSVPDSLDNLSDPPPSSHTSLSLPGSRAGGLVFRGACSPSTLSTKSGPSRY